jgi:hypothetical protein
LSTEPAPVVAFATPKDTLERLAASHNEDAARFRAEAEAHDDASRRAWAKADKHAALAVDFADAAAKLEGGQ